MTRDLHLSLRITGLKPSATVEMTERVRQARLAGAEIIGLSSGDPNAVTHPAIIEAAHRSLKDGETHYGPPPGKLALREAVARCLSAESGVRYEPDQILVTPGGKFAVYASILAVVEPGDEIIVLEPGWVSYGPCVQMAGGVPVGVPTLDGVDPQRLAAAVTPRTKMIIVNSPVNPTGRIILKNELETILKTARENGIWILFDEVYKSIVYEPALYTPMQALDGALEHTFVVNSFSKTYGMTGWRIGYLAVPPGLAKSIQKILQHSVYCV
ncbi:MAG: aminotransferase class I/II-fold pyridoxal phosphate-dependent enzyme, partial [Deltaproteobacteria bacterium]|nr:aminotransferase class I/II-fold pyridoxal phosphate-dependent enzyme [Deltaproteobacteria bacterium]